MIYALTRPSSITTKISEKSYDIELNSHGGPLSTRIGNQWEMICSSVSSWFHTGRSFANENRKLMKIHIYARWHRAEFITKSTANASIWLDKGKALPNENRKPMRNHMLTSNARHTSIRNHMLDSDISLDQAFTDEDRPETSEKSYACYRRAEFTHMAQPMRHIA